MKAPREIVDLLGGRVEAANALGVTPSAVSNWLRRGVIPLTYASQLMRLAQARGVKLTYQDLIQ